MRQTTTNGKITIEVKKGYLEGSKYKRKDQTAFIKLFAEEASITLYEVADAIIDCTVWNTESDILIDSERFRWLNINLEINKNENA